MPKQFWNPQTYARDARLVSDLGQGLLEVVAAPRGERVPDLRCGDGVLSRKLVAAGCRIMGADSGAEQVAAGRLVGPDTHVYSAECLPFREAFDAVFGKAVLHWIPDVQAVSSAVRGTLYRDSQSVTDCVRLRCIAERMPWRRRQRPPLAFAAGHTLAALATGWLKRRPVRARFEGNRL
jgi:2-polyprenyl-3-methyl-5-hydroxy-6-metoxy-1,4-benzoquinol methylase